MKSPLGSLRLVLNLTLVAHALSIVHHASSGWSVEAPAGTHTLLAATSKLADSSNSTVHRIPSSKCSLSNEHPVILPGSMSPDACPHECPFAQMLVGDPCNVVCVPPNACAEFHPSRGFADPISHRCVATCGKADEERIPGCAVCASRGRCAKCMQSKFGEFVLSEDGTHCHNPIGFFWTCLYVGLGAIIVFVLYYLVLLACVRPRTNEAMAECAVQHRHKCRPLKMSKHSNDSGECMWKPYKFWRADVHRVDVGGIGVTLYFNLLVFLGSVAMAMFVGCQVALYLSASQYSEAEARVKDQCEDAAAIDSLKLVEDTSSFAVHIFSSLGVTYVLVLIGSWAFYLYQLHTFSWFHSNKSFLSDWSLCITGLPADATDDKALTKELQDKLGDFGDGKVVGVSICYVLSDNTEQIQQGIDAWIMEKEFTFNPPWKRPSPRSQELSRVSEDSKVVDFLKLGFIDDMLVNREQVPPEAKKQAIQVMQTSECSGTAFVMLSNEATVCRFKRALQDNPEIMGCKIACERPYSEPRGVIYENFERPENKHFYKKMGIGCLCILATIAIWAALYLPYAVEYITLSQVPGARPAFLEDAILGALIGIGNVLVGNVIEMVVEWIGFEFKAVRDMWVLGLAFIASLLNVFADLFMTMQVAQGVQLDESFHGDPVGYDTIMGRELFALIVPGYLFVPYILQPLVEYMLPYVVFKWLVRTDTCMHLREAEKALEPPPFDIVWRYADSLNNFLVCMVLLIFLTPTTGSIMFWLVLFFVYIYALDKVSLFHRSVTSYTCSALSDAFALWWSIPTGMFAGIVAWWGVKAGVLVQAPAFTMVSGIVLVHVLVYVSVVLLLRSPAYCFITYQERHAHGEYTDALQERRKHGKSWDYFTTNPGHCLKTWGSEDELFYYTRGKQHLLPWADWDCGGASHNFREDVNEGGVLSGRVHSLFHAPPSSQTSAASSPRKDDAGLVESPGSARRHVHFGAEETNAASEP